MRPTSVKKPFLTDAEIRERLGAILAAKKLRAMSHAWVFVKNMLGKKRDAVLSPAMRQFAQDIIKENPLPKK